jgi:hypothetical protein
VWTVYDYNVRNWNLMWINDGLNGEWGSFKDFCESTNGKVGNGRIIIMDITDR